MQQTISADESESPLTVSPEKVCFVIIKARAFDAKDEVTEPDPGSNPADDMENWDISKAREFDVLAKPGRDRPHGSTAAVPERRLQLQ